MEITKSTVFSTLLGGVYVKVVSDHVVGTRSTRRYVYFDEKQYEFGTVEEIHAFMMQCEQEFDRKETNG